MLKRALFELHIGVQIDHCCLGGFVPEPQGNNGQIHTSAEEGHGRRMSQRVRRDRSAFERRTVLRCRYYMTFDQTFQCITAEKATAGAWEDRVVISAPVF